MKVDGIYLKLAIREALRAVEEKSILDNINVFPVADRDTGTNIYLTLKGTWEEIASLSDRRASVIADRVAKASIEHARGNSGVILSQFLWGFRIGVNGKVELGAKDLAAALISGSNYAYEAVVLPVEGTMLTVMREVSEWSSVISHEVEDLEVFLKEIF